MAALAAERGCLAPDLMGLGYTDVAADADLSAVAQTAMMIALLDRLEIGEADIIARFALQIAISPMLEPLWKSRKTWLLAVSALRRLAYRAAVATDSKRRRADA